MAIIITYDVPSKHIELKNALLKLGYKDQIPDTSKVCKNGIIYCPNTTLFHETKSSSAARADVQQQCMNLGVKLERCVATTWNNWAAVCGEPFK